MDDQSSESYDEPLVERFKANGKFGPGGMQPLLAEHPDPSRLLKKLIAADIKQRSEIGNEKVRIEEYFAAFPELLEESDRLELLIAEFEHRRRIDDPKLDPDSYQARLPDQFDAFLKGLRLERLGDYWLVKELGRGGFGRVYRGKQVGTEGRFVAIKILHAQDHNNSAYREARERFRREAEALD